MTITAQQLAQISNLVKTAQAEGGKKPADPAKAAAREAARAEREAKRAVEREARLAARKEKAEARAASKAVSNGSPAYTRRLEKLAAQLPAPTGAVEELIELAKSLATVELSTLVAHLNYEIRSRALTAATSGGAKTFSVGDTVMIRECSHNPKFSGMIGVVKEARRIRAFVQIPDMDTPAYCFLSELEPANLPIDVAPTSETLTEITAV